MLDLKEYQERGYRLQNLGIDLAIAANKKNFERALKLGAEINWLLEIMETEQQQPPQTRDQHA